MLKKTRAAGFVVDGLGKIEPGGFARVRKMVNTVVGPARHHLFHNRLNYQLLFILFSLFLDTSISKE